MHLLLQYPNLNASSDALLEPSMTYPRMNSNFVVLLPGNFFIKWGIMFYLVLGKHSIYVDSSVYSKNTSTSLCGMETSISVGLIQKLSASFSEEHEERGCMHIRDHIKGPSNAQNKDFCILFSRGHSLRRHKHGSCNKPNEARGHEWNKWSSTT